MRSCAGSSGTRWLQHAIPGIATSFHPDARISCTLTGLWLPAPSLPGLSLLGACRLQQLERSERVGPLVQDIQARSLRVHALILQHRAAVKAGFGLAPAPQQPASQQQAIAPAAAAGAEDPGAEAGQQQQQHAVAAAGEKRKAGEGEAAEGEPASKRQRGSEGAAAGGEAAAGEAAQGAAEAEDGAAGAAAAEGGAAPDGPAAEGGLRVLPPDADVEGALRLLRMLLPPDIARQLRKGRLPEVAALLRQLAELTEQVVAAAPKQFKKKISRQPAGGATRRAPGPKPLAPAARKQLRPGGTQVAARPHSLLKRWAAALRGSGGRPSTPAGVAGPPGSGAAARRRPGPAVTAAMALAESLLYLGAETGVLGALCCAAVLCVASMLCCVVLACCAVLPARLRQLL